MPFHGLPERMARLTGQIFVAYRIKYKKAKQNEHRKLIKSAIFVVYLLREDLFVGSDLGIYVILRWTMVELGIPNSKT